MPGDTHRIVQTFRQRVQRLHGVAEGSRPGIGRQAVQLRPRVIQELAHGGFHVFGANSIERNLKFNFEKWISDVARRHFI
jgi:hypothetical protein